MFEKLKGKILVEIQGLEVGSEKVNFTDSEGVEYVMHHHQDCCEYVSIEDVSGDIQDILNSEILLAEEVSSTDPSEQIVAERKARYEKALSEFKPSRVGHEFYFFGPNPSNNWKEESETWTFYKLATIKGSITIRWLGSSNGYYSESVDFHAVNDESAWCR